MRVRPASVTASAILSIVAVVGCADIPAADSSAALPTPTPRAGNAQLTKADFLPTTKKAMSTQHAIKISARITVRGRVRTTMTGVEMPNSNPRAMSVVVNGPSLGGKSRMIVTNGLVYLSAPGVAPNGKYVKLNPDDANDRLAAAAREVIAEMAPDNAFAAFEAGLKTVEHVGPDTIAGQRMAHYKATIDVEAAAKAKGQAVPQGMPPAVLYNVWLDTNNLMRRRTTQLAGVEVVVSMTPDPHAGPIKPPPASQIVYRSAGA